MMQKEGRDEKENEEEEEEEEKEEEDRSLALELAARIDPSPRILVRIVYGSHRR